MSEAPITAVEVRSDLLVVRVLVERLGDADTARLQTDVRAAASEHPGLPCVLDLAKVNYVPSMSLAMFVRLYSEFKARRQRLVLAALHPLVREVFVMTRLDRLFELQDDVDSASRAVGAG